MASTLGGKQFWADVWFFRSWRIQRNAISGGYRLLDEKNRRHASGTFDACREACEGLRAKGDWEPMRGEAVVVLHGLFRTRSSMGPMCRYLQQEGGYLVFNVGYPSTRGTVGDHARDLARVIDSLEGVEMIHFVAHSLGNLVIRHWMADQQARPGGLRTDSKSTQGLPHVRKTTSSDGVAVPALNHVPLGRMVMLGPPNQGARLAERLIPIDWTGQITGPAAGQLATGW
ncbi:MAG: esterase/lipase family protein, partial [Pirellulales bacterium]